MLLSLDCSGLQIRQDHFRDACDLVGRDRIGNCVFGEFRKVVFQDFQHEVLRDREYDVRLQIGFGLQHVFGCHVGIACRTVEHDAVVLFALRREIVRDGSNHVCIGVRVASCSWIQYDVGEVLVVVVVLLFDQPS